LGFLVDRTTLSSVKRAQIENVLRNVLEGEAVDDDAVVQGAKRAKGSNRRLSGDNGGEKMSGEKKNEKKKNGRSGNTSGRSRKTSRGNAAGGRRSDLEGRNLKGRKLEGDVPLTSEQQKFKDLLGVDDDDDTGDDKDSATGVGASVPQGYGLGFSTLFLYKLAYI
jgi:hypothetical protein